MIVMKFGGTSVGSPERMKHVAELITESGNPTFVVLSAMSGTTNTLIEIADYLYKKNPEGANEVINMLEKKVAQRNQMGPISFISNGVVYEEPEPYKTAISQYLKGRIRLP